MNKTIRLNDEQIEVLKSCIEVLITDIIIPTPEKSYIENTKTIMIRDRLIEIKRKL